MHVVYRHREIEPPHLLSYRWVSSWQQHPLTLVRWGLRANGDGTDVKVTHNGLRDHAEARRDYGSGWPRVLAWRCRDSAKRELRR